MQNYDRPIQPDAHYLEQAQRKYQESLKKIHPYLKKKQQPELACHKHHAQPKSQIKEKKKTKAEQYEELKEKNRKKFGEWKKKQEKKQEQEKRKIKPKNMTVKYSPKKLHIQTEQYKKVGYIPPKKQEEDQDKVKYQKLIDYLKNEMVELEEEKEKFNEEKQSLKFKKRLEKEENLYDIRSKVDNKWQISHERTEKNRNKQNKQKNQNQRLKSSSRSEKEKEEEFKIFSKPIEKIHECPLFDLTSIHQYIDKKSILYYNNSLYREGVQVAENERHSAQVEQYEDKRITKFQKGWFEVWYPGKKRILGREDYKVVWFSNGDVKQVFPNGYCTYYCQRTKVIKIEKSEDNVIWYFPEQNQLESNRNGKKEVIFNDGRHELIETD